jgi:hypothetical protein
MNCALTAFSVAELWKKGFLHDVKDVNKIFTSTQIAFINLGSKFTSDKCGLFGQK